VSGFLLAGATGLCWIATLLRLPPLMRRCSTLEQRAFCLALFGLAAGLTSQIPPVYRALGTLSRVPNVGVPVGHGLVLIAAWAASAMLLYSTYAPALGTRRANRRLVVLVVGLLTMVVLFSLVPAQKQTLEYVKAYGRLSLVTYYYLIYLALLGLAAGDIARLCWRYGRLAQRDVLRVGLQLVAISAVIAILYVLYKGTNVTGNRLHARLPLGDETVISRTLLVVGTVLVTAGTSVSRWGPRLQVERLYVWLRHFRSYRRLSPLWRDLQRATPEIALYPPASSRADAIAVRDLHFRLHRRVIEISDGLLSVRPFLDADIAAQARQAALGAGVSGDELMAVVEAAVVSAGIAAKSSGRPTAAIPAPPHLNGDPSGEVAWLERVAGAYAHSPLVRSVREQERRRRVATDGAA